MSQTELLISAINFPVDVNLVGKSTAQIHESVAVRFWLLTVSGLLVGSFLHKQKHDIFLGAGGEVEIVTGGE